MRHGAKVKLCSIEGCNRYAETGGVYHTSGMVHRSNDVAAKDL